MGYPNDFEFNEQLLLDLASFVTSNRFGTFLGDNESECVSRYATKTESVWSYILRNKGKYVKMSYNACASGGGQVADSRNLKFLPIVFAQPRLKLWNRFWFRYHPHLWNTTE